MKNVIFIMLIILSLSCKKEKKETCIIETVKVVYGQQYTAEHSGEIWKSNPDYSCHEPFYLYINGNMQPMIYNVRVPINKGCSYKYESGSCLNSEVSFRNDCE